jgi:hypothetical protein
MLIAFSRNKLTEGTCSHLLLLSGTKITVSGELTNMSLSPQLSSENESKSSTKLGAAGLTGAVKTLWGGPLATLLRSIRDFEGPGGAPYPFPYVLEWKTRSV